MLTDEMRAYLDYLTQDVESAARKAATWMRVACISYLRKRYALSPEDAAAAVDQWVAGANPPESTSPAGA